MIGWSVKGFASCPERKASPNGGVLLYRCWGSRSSREGSSEWGSGFFSVEKPRTVLEAELKFNVVEWGNGVNFVSTFRLRGGMEYWLGPVWHHKSDARIHALQAFIYPPLL